MRILFCNITWMKFYRGDITTDTPQGGGSYVEKNRDGEEIYNFRPRDIYFNDNSKPAGEYCLGYVETKATTASQKNQLHIEKIDGCELCGKDDFVEDVLVVYCAKHEGLDFTTVVGWYQHATVYRRYESIEVEDDGEIYIQYYNALARREDCVLLPEKARSRILDWKVPRKQGGISYGFGRANVWFASEQHENEYLQNFLKKLTDRIKNYDGENWIV